MRNILLVIVAIVSGFGAKAQVEAPVKWSYASKKVSATEAIVYIKATINDKWHIYGLDVKDGGPKTEFTFATSKNYQTVGKTIQPASLKKYEPALKMDITYFEKSVIFEQKVRIKSGKAVVNGQLEYIACNDHKCLPPEEVNFSIPLDK